MSNATMPPVRSCADLNDDADCVNPMTPSPVSPVPLPHRGSGAPPFMLPTARRRGKEHTQR